MKQYDVKSMQLLLVFAATVAATMIATAATGGYVACDNPSAPAVSRSEKLAQTWCCERRCVGSNCWCVKYCTSGGGVRG